MDITDAQKDRERTKALPNIDSPPTVRTMGSSSKWPILKARFPNFQIGTENGRKPQMGDPKANTKRKDRKIHKMGQATRFELSEFLTSLRNSRKSTETLLLSKKMLPK